MPGVTGMLWNSVLDGYVPRQARTYSRKAVVAAAQPVI